MASARWLDLFQSNQEKRIRQATAPQRIQAEEFRRLQKDHPGLLLLDVRTPAEFQAKRIPGSVLFPLYTLRSRQQELPQEKNHPIVVYCLSGARSHSAAQELDRLGYTQIYDLGAIMQWPYECISG